VVSVYDRLVDVSLELAADRVVFFTGYDSELVEVVYHETMSRKSLMDSISVIGAGEYVLYVSHLTFF
jgi:hypothetical protein